MPKAQLPAILKAVLLKLRKMKLKKLQFRRLKQSDMPLPKKGFCSDLLHLFFLLSLYFVLFSASPIQ